MTVINHGQGQQIRTEDMTAIERKTMMCPEYIRQYLNRIPDFLWYMEYRGNWIIRGQRTKSVGRLKGNG